MTVIQEYLQNSHHMQPEELLNNLLKIANSPLPKLEPTTIDRLKLQLDADNSNADLFYDPATAQEIHHLVTSIFNKLEAWLCNTFTRLLLPTKPNGKCIGSCWHLLGFGSS